MFFNTDFLQNEEIKLVLERTDDAVPEKRWVPGYHFAVCSPDGVKLGICALRIGHSERTYYGGNIGYEIFEPYRGHHYAAKACRLLFELARKHGLGYVMITCRPDNTASFKTCEYLGCQFLGEQELPEDSDMRGDGRHSQCIFRFDL